MSNKLPSFASPVTWDIQNSYEALSIVLYDGHAYTSKQDVPVGTLLTDTNYWYPTGNIFDVIKNIKDKLATSAVSVLTLTNCTPGANDSYYYKSFGVVNLFLDLTPDAPSGGVVKVAELPVGFRPIRELKFPLTEVVHNATYMNTAYLNIQSNGDIELYIGSPKRVFVNVCFPTQF